MMAARKGKKKILETKKYRLLLLSVVRSRILYRQGSGFAGRSIGWREGGKALCRLVGVGRGRVVVVVVVEIKKYTQL